MAQQQIQDRESDPETLRVYCVWKVPHDKDLNPGNFPDAGIFPTGELMAIRLSESEATSVKENLEANSPSDRFGDSMGDAPYHFHISARDVPATEAVTVSP